MIPMIKYSVSIHEKYDKYLAQVSLGKIRLDKHDGTSA